MWFGLSSFINCSMSLIEGSSGLEEDLEDCGKFTNGQSIRNQIHINTSSQNQPFADNRFCLHIDPLVVFMCYINEGSMESQNVSYKGPWSLSYSYTLLCPNSYFATKGVVIVLHSSYTKSRIESWYKTFPEHVFFKSMVRPDLILAISCRIILPHVAYIFATDEKYHSAKILFL
jgi:hypothetical protein